MELATCSKERAAGCSSVESVSFSSVTQGQEPFGSQSMALGSSPVSNRPEQLQSPSASKINENTIGKCQIPSLNKNMFYQIF